jgi:outer membrane protein assembly factor BamA
MKSTRRITLLFLLALTAALAFAETALSDRITGISVEGLKRTKLFVVENALRKFIGQNAAALDHNAVRAAILETGILEPVTVETKPSVEDMTLVVIVREKWTFFPVPIFMVSSGSIMGGAALMEANAFGINDKFFVAGFYSSDGWMAGGSDTHTAVRGAAPGISGFGMFFHTDTRDTDQNDNALRRYTLDSIIASIRLEYPFTDLFSASLGVSFNDKIIRENSDAFNVPEPGAMGIGLRPELSIRANTWDGYLPINRGASLSYSYMLGVGPPEDRSPNVQQINVKGDFEKSLIPGFKLNTLAEALYSIETTPLYEVSPSSIAGILPSSVSASHFAGAAAGLEKYIYKWSFGTLSALASYQVVYSWGPILEEEFDHGVTAALVFYMARIALPAVAAGASYNVRAGYWQAYFSIGMSM